MSSDYKYTACWGWHDEHGNFMSNWDDMIEKQMQEAWDLLQRELEGKPKMFKCECGSDAVGSPRHSDWCPKSEVSLEDALIKFRSALAQVYADAQVTAPGLQAWINPDPGNPFFNPTRSRIPTLPGSPNPILPPPLTINDFHVSFLVKTKAVFQGQPVYTVVQVDRTRDIVYIQLRVGSSDPIHACNPSDLELV